MTDDTKQGLQSRPGLHRDTVSTLADVVECFDQQCCVHASPLGRELHRRGVEARVFDTDETFADLPGFRAWDVRHPIYLKDEFDLVFCDAAFLGVLAPQLFHGLRILCHYDYSRAIMLTWPDEAEQILLQAFEPFGLRRTNFDPTYRSTRGDDGGDVSLYANFELPL